MVAEARPAGPAPEVDVERDVDVLVAGAGQAGLHGRELPRRRPRSAGGAGERPVPPSARSPPQPALSTAVSSSCIPWPPTGGPRTCRQVTSWLWAVGTAPRSSPSRAACGCTRTASSPDEAGLSSWPRGRSCRSARCCGARGSARHRLDRRPRRAQRRRAAAARGRRLVSTRPPLDGAAVADPAQLLNHSRRRPRPRRSTDRISRAGAPCRA